MNLQDRDTRLSTPVTEGELRATSMLVLPCAGSVFVNRLAQFATGSHHPYRQAVSALRVDQVGACWLTKDMLSGFSVTDERELVGLFSFIRGREHALIHQACDRGATSLHCYDLPELFSLYYAHGFRVHARFAFDPELAEPGWPSSLGKPDYLNMRRQVEFKSAGWKAVP